jgi:peptidoglycan/xylan/chitin deacetylase (PgdA/CDA1 family)
MSVTPDPGAGGRPGNRTRSRMGRRSSRRRRRRLVAAILVLILALVAMAAFFGVGTSSSNEPASSEQPAESADAVPPVDTGGNFQDEPGTLFTALSFPARSPVPASVVKLPTLMFHHVGEPPPGADEIRVGLTVSGADFEAMMAYLKEAGYHPVTQTQLFQALFEGVPLPEKPVMLTFDDGYLDNYQVAVPALQKYGFPATFYVITDKIGTSEYMTWEQVMELDREGMDIGSHTSSHLDLTTLSAADLQHELGDSGAAISSRLGHPVYWLCYPAGEYDADVINYSRAAGYLLAVTTEPGEQQSSDSPFEIMRYRVRSDTGLEGFKELVR